MYTIALITSIAISAALCATSIIFYFQTKKILKNDQQPNHRNNHVQPDKLKQRGTEKILGEAFKFSEN